MKAYVEKVCEKTKVKVNRSKKKEKIEFEKEEDERDRIIRKAKSKGINKVHELQEIINEEEYMTTLQEKENEIRKKTRQLHEEFRIYMKIYKEMELKVDRISLDEGLKEKMKVQQKDAESPPFPFSIESKGIYKLLFLIFW